VDSKAQRMASRGQLAAAVLLLTSLSSPASGQAPPAAGTAQPPANPAPALAPETSATPAPTERFQFGSYGRVPLGSDLQGGSPRQLRLVAHPPRLSEAAYAEIDLGYFHELAGGGGAQTQFTLALGDKLFHANGDFDSALAVRNLYLEFRDVGLHGLQVWGGSRMYRGDDIYLLDFWPLDEQNTVGGGIGYRWGQTSLRAHLGLNRLDDPWQTQWVTVRAPEFGTRDLLWLDRQRVVGSLRGEQHVALGADLGFKAVLYGEGHAVAEGERRQDDGDLQTLPAERGWLAGAELALYSPDSPQHINLFLRWGQGLAAYDELATPADPAQDGTAGDARELLLGMSANLELAGRFGLLFGGYLRGFRDGDGLAEDYDDGVELGAALRPAWFVTPQFHLLGEANVQYRHPNGLDPALAVHETPMAVQLAILPSLALGAGSYSRPQLRLVYAATLLNEAARHTLAPEDPRAPRRVEHYLGLQVEWWFHSSRND